MGLFGRKTAKHAGGRGDGQPAAPRRLHAAAQCPCGNGKVVGHPGKCTIPTGTFRNGQRSAKSPGKVGSTVNGRKYVKRAGPRF